MNARTRFDRSGRRQRDAFTLMELMVVVTIMAALVALSASAVLKFIEVQQTSNTQSTLDRAQSQLIKAWSKVKDQALKEPIPPGVVALAGTDANAAERARVLYVKLKLRQAFPMNFAEALNVPYYNAEVASWFNLPATTPMPGPPVSPLPPLPGYVSYLANLGITQAIWSTNPPLCTQFNINSPPIPDPRESSICLLMALQRGVSGAGIDPSELTAGGAAGSMVTPSGGSIPYLTDAWGRPIFFSRCPAGSFYLNPLGPVAGNNDPGDPQGYLNSGTWPMPLRQQFSMINQQLLAPPPTSYKLAPMIASSGPINWTKTWPPPNWYWSPVPTLRLPGPVPPTPGAPALTFDPITFGPVQGAGALFSTP